MDKWLEAYASWPPTNQVIFSTVVVAAALTFFFMVGMWALAVLDRIGEWKPRRGDDDGDNPVPVKPKGGKTKSLLGILDWRKEHQQMQEEQELQAKVQAEHEEAMRTTNSPPPTDLPTSEMMRNGSLGSVKPLGKVPPRLPSEAAH